MYDTRRMHMQVLNVFPEWCIYGESDLFFFGVGLTIFVAPVGVIIGAVLGAVGIIRKKKKTDGGTQT